MKLCPCLFQHFLYVKLAPSLTRPALGSCTSASPFCFFLHWGLNFFHNCLAAFLAPCLAPWLAACLKVCFFMPGVDPLWEFVWLGVLLCLFFVWLLPIASLMSKDNRLVTFKTLSMECLATATTFLLFEFRELPLVWEFLNVLAVCSWGVFL